MRLNNRRSLAQNFIARSRLVALMLDESSIVPGDIVYEIGPGTGMLTKKLVKKARKVIAIEKDRELYVGLKKKFGDSDNLMLFHADFLKFEIRESRYKIFSNIPFNITSAVIRKIVCSANPPLEAYLIMQREAAEKFTGAIKTTQFSVLAKPWFKLKMIRCFKRSDFSPIPAVDVVMLYVEKRTPCLIPQKDLYIYERFIKCGFGAWRKNLRQNYRNIFSYGQWKRLSRELAFPFHSIPSELNFRQWLGLYVFFKKNIYRY